MNVEWLLVPDGLVWVFQKLLIYWDFHAQPSLGFTEKGNSNSNNFLLQPRYAENHLWTHNTSNPEADASPVVEMEAVAEGSCKGPWHHFMPRMELHIQV